MATNEDGMYVRHLCDPRYSRSENSADYRRMVRVMVRDVKWHNLLEYDSSERCVCLQVTVIGLETVCLKSEIHPPAKKARLDKFFMASHLTTAGCHRSIVSNNFTCHETHLCIKLAKSTHYATCHHHIPTKPVSLTYSNSYNWNLWKKDVRFKACLHVQDSEWPSGSTSSFCRPYLVFQTFLRHRCKSTETDYFEISYWELQTVLQHQDGERLEFSASVRRVSWLFSIV